MTKYLIFSILIIASLAISCKSPPEKILNRDPNGTSELQLTMRNMYDYFESVKSKLEKGVHIVQIESFHNISTDNPTEDGKNTTEIYKTMANSYFMAVNNMKENKDSEAYDLIIDTCMGCHRQLCPGPMVKIKKLYFDQETK